MCFYISEVLENLQHDNWFVGLLRADFQVFVLDYKWQVLIPGKTENFSCLKEDAQLRKQWQKFGIKKILAVRGICTSSYVPVKVQSVCMCWGTCVSGVLQGSDSYEEWAW